MRGLLRAVLDLFSSVRLGVTLFVLLFIYMSIGSAGVIYPVHPNILHPAAWRHEQIRQRPIFEMTEFEWFHWWPFDLMLALLTANLIVTTIRRIPFKPINYGVWMIHSGIVILIVGSVIYFVTKVEGEAPVVRRAVVVEMVDGNGEVVASNRVLAMPGNSTALGTDREGFAIEVLSTDPQWELLSGRDAGQRAFSANLLITRPDGTRFVRQLIDGHPEYTEDLVFTADRDQPLQRAVRLSGEAIIEPRIVARMEYESQGWVYLRNDISKAWALYVRKPGELEWTMRPIHGLPLYNEWVGSFDDVTVPDGLRIPSRPLDIRVPAVADNDPFPDVAFEIDGYLRYAVDRTRLVDGGPGAPFNPSVGFTLRGSDGMNSTYTLAAFDPSARTAEQGLLRFRTVASEEEFERLVQPPALRFRIPSLGIDLRETIDGVALVDPQRGMTPIGDPSNGYSYRVVALEDDVPIAGTPVSLAIVELRTPSGPQRRWVFDRAEMTRDAPTDASDPHRAPALADPSIEVLYEPGIGRSIVLLVAGPEPERLRSVTAIGSEPAQTADLSAGERTDLGAGLSIEVTRYLPRALSEPRPLIVHPAQRIRDAGELLSRVRLRAPEGAPTWLPFHPYVFDRPEERIRRNEYRPTRIRLADGRVAEVIFGRQRIPLPTEIILDTFVLTSHVGGYTGETGSIRDYTSVLRFRKPDGSWGAPTEVSVNAPVENGGFSYFQAKWDPPEEARRQGERASQGLNYTVLGVGNRHGVYTQLFGVVLSTIGMIYAFYVKPILKRRRIARVHAEVAASGRALSRKSGSKALASTAIVALAMVVPMRAAFADTPSEGAPPKARSFAEQVDLRPLGSIAVHSEGRLKSYGSFANTIMNVVSGPRTIAGQSTAFTYLDMLLRPEAYADADVIYIKNREVRARIAEAWRAAAGDAAVIGRPIAGIDVSTVSERMDVFERTGLISEQFLVEPGVRQWRRELANVMRELEGDLIRTARQVDQITAALNLKNPATLLMLLRILPPGGGRTDAPWRTIGEIQLLPGPDGFDANRARRMGAEAADTPLDGLDPELQAQIAAAWRALVTGWGSGDANAVNKAVQQLADLLHMTDPEVYPETARLWWESWYFRNGNMTRVWLVFMGAIVFLLLGLVYRWPTALRIGLVVFAVAFLLQTTAVGLRWWISGRWPNSNMFEAVTTAAWMGTCAAVVLEILARRMPMRGYFALGASVGSMVALMAVALMPAQLNPNISNMMPVLHDVWLYIHTNVIIFSYALIFMAAVSAFAYMIHRITGGAATFARVGGAGEMLAMASGGAAMSGVPGSDALTAHRGARLGEVLDGVTMLLMEISFVLLWAGIAMGAIWADHSWGRPWGWDPKEVFALNTFLVFAILIHVRLYAKDKGLWTAVLAVIGAAVMLFNWIVINFVITGLHSYA
ncbi:MAG: cytochrome c biogenesis protein CcsA [Phycisphaeraceae bacterium]|nr:cytochrome c biogenesis protein CcsA [Phycisphaeraceae bacterium]